MSRGYGFSVVKKNITVFYSCQLKETGNAVARLHTNPPQIIYTSLLSHSGGVFLLKGGMTDLTSSTELYLFTPCFYSRGE